MCALLSLAWRQRVIVIQTTFQIRPMGKWETTVTQWEDCPQSGLAQESQWDGSTAEMDFKGTT